MSKRGELFPCLLERTATAVGVGDGVERALLEVSKVALDRAMHKEEERRIDNGKKICKPKVNERGSPSHLSATTPAFFNFSI